MSGEIVTYCETCGESVKFLAHAVICINCWEVEGRLDRYLDSPKGRAFVAEKLAHVLAELAE